MSDETSVGGNGAGATPVLRPGRNCWRIAHAERIAFLIDGAAYFRALHCALTRARHQIFIVGWDIAPDTELVSEPADDWPGSLGELLETLVQRRPQLQIHVLVWDARVFKAPLPLLPGRRRHWQTRPRLHLRLDDGHPLWGSHHQKIVVIDDRMAFCGGLDITHGRRDTPTHRPDLHPGRHPRAYHDVQLAVDGEAAAALGQLARRRWGAATGRAPAPPPADDEEHPWPPRLAPDLSGARLAIARTLPAWGARRTPVREVEALYLDMIAAANHSIYIENQFFTAERIAAALGRRLREKQGPEVVLVMPLETEGWLSRVTLDAMRGRLLERLRRADRHGRFRVYYPHIPGAPLPVNMHSKVMVIDDALVRVGSANINNRSMGLDTECDMAIEAGESVATRRACGTLRDRLLAEHLGSTPARVREALRSERSLIAAIESLRGEHRSLRPLRYPRVPGTADYLQSGTDMLDPGAPLVTETVMRELVAARDERRRTRRRIAWRLGALLLVILAAVAWRWTPFGDGLEADTLLTTMAELRAMPLTPLLVMLGYTAASLVAIPITLLVLATLISFGPWQGLVYAFCGSMLGAAAGYAAGSLAGKDLIRRLAGSRIDTISRRVASHGVLAVIIVRCVPVAPFTVINLVAGASHIRLRQFLIGTALGMAPGMLAIALFTDRIIASVEAPTPLNYLILGMVVLAIAAAAWGASHWLGRRDHARRT